MTLRRLLSIALHGSLGLIWLIGLMCGFFAETEGNRIVGMLLWLGIGLGERLYCIELALARKSKASQE